MPLLLDWRTAAEPAELIKLVANALHQGERVGIPSDTGYVIMGRPESLQIIPGSGAIFGRDASDLEPWTGALGLPTKRILDRLWPGPLGVIVEANDGPLRFRSPRHPLIDEIARSIDFPLAFGENSCESVEGLGESPAVIVDAGPLKQSSPTWINVVRSDWRVESMGAISERELRRAAARWIVFVCTGNTCRSPMAEAIAKSLLAERLGCRIDELLERGYRLFSAGVSAYPGDAASPEAVEVVQEWNGDLGEHRSRLLAVEDVARADDLIAMTRSHLLAVLTRYPMIGGSLRLLCGNEGDLEDPIGAGREVYTACARRIHRSLNRIFQETVRS